MTRYTHRPSRTRLRRAARSVRRTRIAAYIATLVLSTAVACTGNDELRDIDRGTDHLPGVKKSPIEEGN